jgi:hypothetical protein
MKKWDIFADVVLPISIWVFFLTGTVAFLKYLILTW